MKKHIVFLILFPILYLLLVAFALFFLDLTNGPIFLFVIEIIGLVLFLVASIVLINQKKRIRFIPILSILVLTIIVCATSKPETKIKRAATGNTTETEVLSLKNGQVKGLITEDNEVEVYAGIPYATPPVGNLRWKEPEPVKDWSGVLDCTNFASRSMQPKDNPITGTIVDIYAEKGWHPDYNSYPLMDRSEDSLYLNIWRPKNITGNLPILVYIHGGSLTNGTGASDDINGEAMAKKGVIMITIQYRLGVFGYFAHPDLVTESSNDTTGNYGLLDQIEALKWVNDNASYFGGDKNNITIAGESAGSSSVSALCVSPLAKGLFKKAIGASSSVIGKYPPHTWRSMDSALETGKNIMSEMNCNSIDELRKLPAEKLVNTKYANSSMTIDGYALTEAPNVTYQKGNNNEEALLNGYNVKEADPFVIPTILFDMPNKDNIESKLAQYFDSTAAHAFVELYKDEIEADAASTFNKIISAYWFYMPHYEWSTMAYNNGVRVYRYQFTKENGYYGTYHSGEIIYSYGNLARSTKQFAYNDEDYKLSEKMLSYWSNFAKVGNPNGTNLASWSEWNPTNNNLLELGTNISMFTEKHLAAYKIIESWNARTH